jgi:hypothetical protein
VSFRRDELCDILFISFFTFCRLLNRTNRIEPSYELLDLFDFSEFCIEFYSMLAKFCSIVF